MNLTHSIWETIGGILLAAWCLFATGWFIWRRLRNSRDPGALALRWIVTISIGVWLGREGIIARAAMQAQSPAAAMIVVYSALGGMIIAILWVPVIADTVSNFFGSLYTGGNEEVEAKPFYSIFRAKRSKGQYFEALAEVRKQLDKFPTDFEGHMLLAELQAENLNDLPGAEVTIHRACAVPEQTPMNISFALNKLADWHLGLTKDREGAQRALEKIIELLPETEMALRASQRIGHLADTDMLLSQHTRDKIEVKKGVRNLGLYRGEDGRLKAPETNWEKVAAEYVEQLEKHPLDTHAREKLAEVYAKHYHRLDLAVDQLEQLITQPGQSARNVVRWLNLMTDLQVLEGDDAEKVAATLQRIVDLYPDNASAETARRRLDRLKLEIKGQQKGREVKLGTYDQDIGLKRKF